MIHLDANFLVGLSRESPRETAMLKAWIAEQRPIATSTLAWTEFLCGPVAGDAILALSELVGEPVTFEAADCGSAASLFNGTGRRPRSLMDCMIAAVALRSRAALATQNVRDFQRFAQFGLHIAK